MRNRSPLLGMVFLIFTAAAIVLSILGPEMLSRYQDRNILNQIHQETAADEGEGYRYAMSSSEKLYLLSEALANYRTAGQAENGYQEDTGSYAFIVNHRGPNDKQITADDIYSSCNSQLELLKNAGILPVSVTETEQKMYAAVLYSAIDVLEPRNNVSVWHLSLSDSQRSVSRQNKLMEVYIDADDGKIYEFYARTEWNWEKIDPDRIASAWCTYMEFPEPERYETENPLLETTSYFQKYRIAHNDGEELIITIGFYEGINEVFLKVGR